ncbi:MAG: hypothetical protein REI45_11350 [Propionicimonas sp.]|nr:hypothetical protein [Propionicimonas sp.]
MTVLVSPATGCACAAVSCPAPVGEVTESATPGATLKVDLSQLWDCESTPPLTCGVVVLNEVRVDLVSARDTSTPVDTATVPVAPDATALAELTLPVDAAGVFFVMHDTTVLDSISVTRPE